MGPTQGGSTAPRETVRSDLSALARGGLLNLGGGVTSVVLGFAFAIVVTRGLHAAKAGVLFEVIALFTIATALSQFGADTGLMRAIARRRALRQPRELRPAMTVAFAPVLVAGILAAVV